MRRLFWLAMGVTIGVMVMRRLSQAAEALRPNSVAQRAGRSVNSLADAATSFWAEVKAGAREREAQIREAAALDGGSLDSRPEDFS